MTRASILLVFLPSAALAQGPAAAFVAGTNTVFSADFSAAGALPPNVRVTKGTPAWGQQGGLSMLKASGPTEFIISFPDILPQQFTIEADLFTSSNAAEIEFAVHGTIGMTGTARSALIVWHHAYTAVFRGGAAAGDKYYYPTADLLPELRNQVARIQIVMDGSHLSYYTNDEMIADVSDLVFKRDKFLLVYLGGSEIPNGEVYLARLRIGSNSGVTAVVPNPSIPGVIPPAAPGALGTPPAPRAPNPALPGPPPPAPITALPAQPAGGTSSSPNLSRTVTLAGFAATGGFSSVAPRTITLAGFTAAGGFSSLAPRTITLAGFTATGPIPAPGAGATPTPAPPPAPVGQTVNGDPPSGVRVGGTGTSITVSWAENLLAESYVVLRTDPDGSQSLRTPSPLRATSFAEVLPSAQGGYRYQVGVRWIDGRYGASGLVPYVVPGPLPAKYAATAAGNVAIVTWDAAPGASAYSIIRNNAEVALAGPCAGTCSINDGGIYGTKNTYVIRSRFPETAGLSQSETPPFSVDILYQLDFQPKTYLVARDGRVDFQITNSANPDGTRGGVVSGTGLGVTVTDPGGNRLAMIVAPDAPLGPQTIQLSAANTAPAPVEVIVIRTPGPAGLSLPWITSGNSAPGTSSTLTVTQLDPVRWSATFNALAPIEFERQGDFGGASFCANSDAVGVVLSPNGAKYGVPSDWVIRLQELKGSPVPPVHLLAAQRLTSDGKVGLIPMTYLTPDCTIAVIIDVVDNPPAPYRLRVYDLLTRQVLTTETFASPNVTYDVVRPDLQPVDASQMVLLIPFKSGGLIRTVIPNRPF